MIAFTGLKVKSCSMMKEAARRLLHSAFVFGYFTLLMSCNCTVNIDLKRYERVYVKGSDWQIDSHFNGKLLFLKCASLFIKRYFECAVISGIKCAGLSARNDRPTFEFDKESGLCTLGTIANNYATISEIPAEGLIPIFKETAASTSSTTTVTTTTTSTIAMTPTTTSTTSTTIGTVDIRTPVNKTYRLISQPVFYSGRRLKTPG